MPVTPRTDIQNLCDDNFVIKYNFLILFLILKIDTILVGPYI